MDCLFPLYSDMDTVEIITAGLVDLFLCLAADRLTGDDRMSRVEI
jgi:hypothetical protein